VLKLVEHDLDGFLQLGIAPVYDEIHPLLNRAVGSDAFAFGIPLAVVDGVHGPFRDHHDAAIFEVDIVDSGDLITTATRIMVEAGAYFVPCLTLKVDVSSTTPLPGREWNPLAEAETRDAYLLHLQRARRRRDAA